MMRSSRRTSVAERPLARPPSAEAPTVPAPAATPQLLSYARQYSGSHASNCSLSALSMSSPSRRANSRRAPSSRIARSRRRAAALKSFAGYSELPAPKTANESAASSVFSTRKSRDISVISLKKPSVPGTADPPA
eukprot:6734527-Prymnesium_polylepis.1